jgi:hypothetical protein
VVTTDYFSLRAQRGAAHAMTVSVAGRRDRPAGPRPGLAAAEVGPRTSLNRRPLISITD